MRYVIRPSFISSLDIVNERHGGNELTPTPLTTTATFAPDPPTRVYSRPIGEPGTWTIPLRGGCTDWSQLAAEVLGSCRPSDTVALATTLAEARRRG